VNEGQASRASMIGLLAESFSTWSTHYRRSSRCHVNGGQDAPAINVRIETDSRSAEARDLTMAPRLLELAIVRLWT
jgi:hypothetical protein